MTELRNRCDDAVEVFHFRPEVIAGVSNLPPQRPIEVIVESVIGSVVAAEVGDKLWVGTVILVDVFPLVLLEINYVFRSPAHETPQQNQGLVEIFDNHDETELAAQCHYPLADKRGVLRLVNGIIVKASGKAEVKRHAVKQVAVAERCASVSFQIEVIRRFDSAFISRYVLQIDFELVAANEVCCSLMYTKVREGGFRPSERFPDSREVDSVGRHDA